jgi:hypothetical protein
MTGIERCVLVVPCMESSRSIYEPAVRSGLNLINLIFPLIFIGIGKVHYEPSIWASPSED